MLLGCMLLSPFLSYSFKNNKFDFGDLKLVSIKLTNFIKIDF